MTQTPPHIILVDDDQNILASLQIALEAENFSVTTYKDGLAALEGITAGVSPDLIILDIKMPRLDGLETLSRLRQNSYVPVIILSSKDAEEDQLSGFARGADDYITKPFSQALLIHRIKALLRRQQLGEQLVQPTNSITDIIAYKDLKLDKQRHLTQWKNQPVQLTVTEFLLLECLVRDPGVVHPRDEMIKAAYGDSMYVDDRIIDSHIKRIRRKFREIDVSFDMIQTLYGAGYRYAEHTPGNSHAEQISGQNNAE